MLLKLGKKSLMKLGFFSFFIVLGLSFILASHQTKSEPSMTTIGENPYKETGKLTRGPSWDKVCSNGKCVVTLYSGTVNIKDKNGTYQPFNKVVKVKKIDDYGFIVLWRDNVVYVDFGSDYKVKVPITYELIDRKYSYEWKHTIDIDNNIKRLSLDKKGKVYGYYDFTSNKEIKKVKNGFQVEDLIFSFDDTKRQGFDVNVVSVKDDYKVVLGYDISKFKVGDKLVIDPSITLQGEGENLGDTYVDKANPNTNYGSNILIVDSNPDEIKRTYIKFNISVISSYVSIINASLTFEPYSSSATGSPDHIRSIHHVFDFTWDGYNETTMTWNNQVCGVNFDDSTDCNLTAEDSISEWTPTTDTFNVTNAVIYENNQGHKNISFVLKASTENDADNKFYLWYYSRESASDKPYLTIYYNDITAPQINDESFNSTLINPNEPVRLNLTVTDYVSNVDDVLATFRYPNATKVNKTMSKLYSSEQDQSSDQEAGTKQIKGWMGPSSCSNNGACDDLGDQTSCEDCPGCSWSSCPFIFSFDKDGIYRLEYEAFSSGAFNFPLVDTKHTLEQCACIDGKRKIRLTEHLKEESTINKLELYEVKTNGYAIMDYNNKIHAFNNSVYPISCYLNGKNCMKEVSKSDDIYVVSPYVKGQLEDEILLEFRNPERKENITLYFEGGKTDIIHNYYGLAVAMLRSKGLMELISKTPLYQNIIRNFMNKLSPTIYIYDNGEWIKQPQSLTGFYAIYTDSKEALEIPTYGNENVKIKIKFANGCFRFDEIKVIIDEIPYTVKKVEPSKIQFNDNIVDDYRVKMNQGSHLYLEYPCEKDTIPILVTGGKYITEKGGFRLIKPPNIIISAEKLYNLFVGKDYLEEMDKTINEYKLYEWKGCKGPIEQDYVNVGIPLVKASCSGDLNCSTYDSDQTNCEACSKCTWTPAGNDTEATKDWNTYNDVDDTTWDIPTKINITVYVSSYNDDGSTAQGNNPPKLQLQIYDGSSWNTIGNFSTGTGNKSLTTTSSGILTGWKTPANRDIRFRGVDFDYYNSTHIDEINVTGVWAIVDYDDWVEDKWFYYDWTDTSTSGTYNVTDVYANDTVGNMNHSTYTDLYFTVSGGGDTTPPTYSDNSTNSTLAGTPIEHRLKWNDNSGLSGYIFQFCNGTWNGTECLGDSNNWLNGWTYRKEINISNTYADLTEYQIMLYVNTSKLISEGKMNSDCSDIRFTNSAGSLIDYYIDEGPSLDCGEENTLIWLKTDSLANNTNTTFYMYYGNPGATSKSNITAVFTYSEPKEIYFAIGAWVEESNMDVISYTDNNNITLNSNGESTILNRGQIYTGFDSGDIVSGDSWNVTGPIAIESAGSNADTVNPISFAGTEFIRFIDRGGADKQWYVYAPFGDGTVYFYNSSSGGSFGLLKTLSVTKRTLYTVTDADGNDDDIFLINSTTPILLAYEYSSASDTMVFYPSSKNIWGMGEDISYGYSGTERTLYKHTDTGSTATKNGPLRETAGGNSDGLGTATHVNATKNFGQGQCADSDGSESLMYWDEIELGKEYFSPVPVQYLSGALTNGSSCSFYNGTDWLTPTITGSYDYPSPKRIYVGDGSDAPADNYGAAGSIINCSYPFFIYLEPNSEDEENLLGWKQARQYVYPEPTYSLGNEETSSGVEGWVNDTWVSFSSNPDWSNVTKVVNSTVGATIAWKVYANDTSDNWNASEVFSYDTTSSGAQTYTENISQSVSVSSSKQVIPTLENVISMPITIIMTAITYATLQLTTSQAVTSSSIFQFVSLIASEISQSIATTSSYIINIIIYNQFSQAIGLDTAYETTCSFINQIYQSVTIAYTKTISSLLNNQIIQSISISSSKIINAIRTTKIYQSVAVTSTYISKSISEVLISIQIGISETTSSVSNLFNDIYQSISVVTTKLAQEIQNNQIVQSISITSSNIAKALLNNKISQSITITSEKIVNLLFKNQIAQSVSLMSENVLNAILNNQIIQSISLTSTKILNAIRNIEISQSVSIAITTTTKLIYAIAYTSILTIANIISPQFPSLSIEISQSISLLSSYASQSLLSNQIIQQIQTINSFISKSILDNKLTQSITIATKFISSAIAKTQFYQSISLTTSKIYNTISSAIISTSISVSETFKPFSIIVNEISSSVSVATSKLISQTTSIATSTAVSISNTTKSMVNYVVSFFSSIRIYLTNKIEHWRIVPTTTTTTPSGAGGGLPPTTTTSPPPTSPFRKLKYIISGRLPLLKELKELKLYLYATISAIIILISVIVYYRNKIKKRIKNFYKRKNKYIYK